MSRKSRSRTSHAITASPPKPKIEDADGGFFHIFVIVIGLALVMVGGFVAWDYRHLWWGSLSQRLEEERRAAEEEEKRPLRLNPATPPGPAPEGMVWIPGGEFYMGSDGDEFKDANYIHRVDVDGFWMDKTELTNEKFAEFVKTTKYVTVAEKPMPIEDIPQEQRKDITPDKLRPFSLVFKNPKMKVDLNDIQAWWDICYSADWKHPEGPDSNLEGREKYPVVHVCYEDAVAYCKWAKKRLPTEAEWEFAGRGGLDRKKFAWGDELKPNGKSMANIWQGEFPIQNTKEDGYEGAAPVASYPANGYGLHDMAGNVWEWCADLYHVDYYQESPRKNPKGPEIGLTFHDPVAATERRVQRGGSFLCAENYCSRYIMGSRMSGEPKSSAIHIGFRCVKDAK